MDRTAATEHVPAYLKIAADLRAKIVEGSLQPGDRIPTESRLMAHHGVSRTVAKYAINVLKGEGLVEGRRGSGVYVRRIRRITRRSPYRDQRRGTGSTSPFARDTAAAGQRGGWSHRSERTTADFATARRLGVDPGDPIMSTRYVFHSDGEPVQASYSREPLAITGGTPVEWPEDGAAVGVVARMDAIGVRIDAAEERVIARSAHPHEIEALRLPLRGAYVLAIERTYYAAGRAVETCDIVFPGDRYELLYQFPVN